jgi:hypothetical protein
MSATVEIPLESSDSPNLTRARYELKYAISICKEDKYYAILEVLSELRGFLAKSDMERVRNSLALAIKFAKEDRLMALLESLVTFRSIIVKL